MWLYTGIIASLFCLLASAGLVITSWSDAGPGVVVFALLTLFWAKMLFTMLRQATNPEVDSVGESEQKSEQEAMSDTEPVGSPTVFIPHWFLMGAILLATLLICLAIFLPLLAR